jgi:hypothetical protein
MPRDFNNEPMYVPDPPEVTEDEDDEDEDDEFFDNDEDEDDEEFEDDDIEELSFGKVTKWDYMPDNDKDPAD